MKLLLGPRMCRKKYIVCSCRHYRLDIIIIADEFMILTVQSA